MHAIRHLVAAFLEGSAPRGAVVRARIRISVEGLITATVTVLAVGLAVGYQVLRFLPRGHRQGRP